MIVVTAGRAPAHGAISPRAPRRPIAAPARRSGAADRDGAATEGHDHPHGRRGEASLHTWACHGIDLHLSVVPKPDFNDLNERNAHSPWGHPSHWSCFRVPFPDFIHGAGEGCRSLIQPHITWAPGHQRIPVQGRHAGPLEMTISITHCDSLSSPTCLRRAD
jgi:hypothetical protein